MSDEENLSPWQRYKKNLGETRPWHLLQTDIPKATDEQADERWSICKTCPELIKLTHQCKKCGCVMNLKVKLAAAECPLGKWGQVDASN